MDFSNKKQALLYLDRNGFYFYQVGFSNIISLGFSETSVKDLDIVDDKSLENQIQAFSVQNKLVPNNITIIISPNLIFEKDILSLDPQQQKEAIEKFINTVPFNNVATYNYNFDKGIKVIGVNEDLYLAIKNGFEKIGSNVSLVLPYHSLGSDAALLNNFTVANISQLLKRVERLRQFNLLHAKILNTQPSQTTPNSTNGKKPKINIRTIAMGGFLLVLLLVLGYMLLNLDKFQ